MNQFYNSILQHLGVLNGNSSCELFLKVIIALVLSLAIYFTTRLIAIFFIRGFISRTKSKWGDALYQNKFFSKLVLIVPPILFHLFISGIEGGAMVYIHRISELWIVVAMVSAILSFMNGVNKIYDSYEMSKDRPITSVIQILRIIIYILTTIIVASILIQKSPINLLYGLGAFTAVLMLVFKDTIIGFISGLQLLSNKMISIGDWIELPNGDANGVVLEINLYTVKVRNWDMTISTIPTYQLVAQPFINWRGMEQSGGRRIQRSILIDAQSIKFLEPSQIATLKELKSISTLLPDILDRYFEAEKDGKMTNLWLFREYITCWLQNHNELNTQMTTMVRQLAPTAAGLPLEVYCFTKTKEWIKFESIQGDIFDHLYAVAPLFGLNIYQYQCKQY